LYKDISSSSDEVSSIKAWLKFSSYKFSLSSQFMPVFNRADWIILVIEKNSNNFRLEMVRERYQTICSWRVFWN